MKIKKFYTDKIFGELEDIDFFSKGIWAGLFDIEKHYQIHSPFLQNSIMLLDIEWFYPLIRCTKSNKIVVINSRIERVEDNVFIYDLSGKLCTSFCAGDGIEDVLICENKIVFTYFDEGIFGDISPSHEGLTVFDFNGKFLFGYHSKFRSVEISDCYCACWKDPQTLIFHPYTEFPLVFLDIEKEHEYTIKVPQEIRGSSAITLKNDNMFFYDTMECENSIISWKPGTKCKILGAYDGLLRGLQDGCFLHVDKENSCYTLISPE